MTTETIEYQAPQAQAQTAQAQTAPTPKIKVPEISQETKDRMVGVVKLAANTGITIFTALGLWAAYIILFT